MVWGSIPDRRDRSLAQRWAPQLLAFPLHEGLPGGCCTHRMVGDRMIPAHGNIDDRVIPVPRNIGDRMIPAHGMAGDRVIPANHYCYRLTKGRKISSDPAAMLAGTARAGASTPAGGWRSGALGASV